MATRRGSRNVFGGAPSVNLLPAAQRAELLHEQTMPKLLLAIVLSAALAGLIWAAGIFPVNLAQDRLASINAESADLVAQIAQHADEQETLSTVNKLDTARGELAADEVLFIEMLDEVEQATPAGVEIDEFSGQLGAPGTEGSPGGDALDLNPLCVADSATITVKFFGSDLGPAPEFARNLESVTGFQCIVGTSVTIEERGGPQMITVQFALGGDALSERFAEVAE